MTYLLLGISITLAFLLIVNFAVAVFASVLWSMIERPAQTLSVQTRTKLIFGLRIIPVASALLFVKAFVVPAYLIHEPEDSGEAVSAKLALIAILCSIGVAFAFARVIQTWWVTHRLMNNWLSRSEPIRIDGVSLPIHRIDHAFPVLAVIGVFRPRIFVAEAVLRALGENELRAAIAHEYGHLRSRDNLKRTVLRICRDLLILPIGKSLDLAWAQNAEAAADDYAAGGKVVNSLDLASALVKISRIVPTGVTPALPIGAYIITDREGDISSRIRRLVSVNENAGVVRSGQIHRRPAFAVVFSAAITLLLALHFSDQRLLLTTHEAIEYFVRAVQ